MCRINGALIFVVAVVAGLFLAAPSPLLGQPTTMQSVDLDAFLPPGVDQLPLPPQIPVQGVSPRTVQLLSEALTKAEDARRVELIRDLGQCRVPGALPAVLACLSDPNPAARAEACRSAGNIADRSAMERIAPLAADADPVVRREVAIAAGRLGGEQAVTKLLADPEGSVYLAAFSAASTAEHADRIAGRLKQLPADHQAMALIALGRLGAVQHGGLVASLADGPIPIRCAAASALGEMKATAHAATVVRLTALTEHVMVRKAATMALVGVLPPDERAARAVEVIDRDADPSVRLSAANVLRTAPTPGGVASLVKQLSTDYPPLAKASREALVAAGDLAIAPAVAMLDDRDPRRREDGSFVLGRLKSNAGFEKHVALLAEADGDSADWPLMAQVATSMGQIRNPAAGSAVVKLASVALSRLNQTRQQFEKPADPKSAAELGARLGAQYHTLAQATIAAGWLGEKSVLNTVKPLIGRREEYSSSVRAAALWAVGVLSTLQENRGISGTAFGIYRNLEETEDMKVEAIKVLGHLRDRSALADLRTLAGEAPANRNLTEDGSPPINWLAHWAADRIEGQATPYKLLTHREVPDVSISDLSNP